MIFLYQLPTVLEVTTYRNILNDCCNLYCNILGRVLIGWRMGIGQNVLNMWDSQTDWSFHGASYWYTVFFWTFGKFEPQSKRIVDEQPQNPTTTIGVANPIAIPLTMTEGDSMIPLGYIPNHKPQTLRWFVLVIPWISHYKTAILSHVNPQKQAPNSYPIAIHCPLLSHRYPTFFSDDDYGIGSNPPCFRNGYDRNVFFFPLPRCSLWKILPFFPTIFAARKLHV